MADTTNPITRITKPLVDLMLLNAETTGAILLQQNAMMAELVQAGVDRARAVADAKDLGEAMRLQTDFGRHVFEKLSAAGRDNWNTMRDAYGKAGSVIRTAVQPSKAA